MGGFHLLHPLQGEKQDNKWCYFLGSRVILGDPSPD